MNILTLLPKDSSAKPDFSGYYVYISFTQILFGSSLSGKIRCEINTEGKGEFDIFYFMTALTLETILNIMELDVDIQNQKPEYRDSYIKNLEKYKHTWSIVIYINLLKFTPLLYRFSEILSMRIFKTFLHNDVVFKMTNLYSKQCEVKEKCSLVFSDDVIKNIRQTPENQNSPKSFVRAFMNPINNLSDNEILDEIKTLIIAAQDTSAIATSASLLLLAMNKDVQDKVLTELHQVLGSSQEIDLENVNELHYLEMVINEAMRLFPVVPFVFREVTEEVEVTDYTIPKGSHILISIFKIHRDKRYWGDDADQFRPERFEKENFAKIHPYAFIPFTSNF